MARLVTLAADYPPREALRSAMVCACALALICARQPLPF
jgi:hypothetical protein